MLSNNMDSKVECQKMSESNYLRIQIGIYDKMVYVCEICGYKSKRKDNFERHKNNKKGCIKTNTGNEGYENGDGMDKTSPLQNIKVPVQNIKGPLQNIKVPVQNIKEYKCKKCDKQLSSKSRLENHENKCNGLDVKCCPTCYRKFNSCQAKYWHIKNTECVKDVSILTNTISSHNTTHTNSHNTTNHITNNNQTIHVNAFGKEDLSYLLEDASIIEHLRMCGKNNVYGLTKLLNSVLFNKDRPENNTIIKPEAYGDGVMIMNEDKEFEYREYEDVIDTLLEIISNCFEAYLSVKKKYGIQLMDKKELMIMQKFVQDFQCVDGIVSLELLEELKIAVDYIDYEDDEDIQKKKNKFKKSSMKSLNSNTEYNYKRENGRYVRRDR